MQHQVHLHLLQSLLIQKNGLKVYGMKKMVVKHINQKQIGKSRWYNETGMRGEHSAEDKKRNDCGKN